MIKRDSLLSGIRTALRRNRVVALLGPRQCGKTTLARQIKLPGTANYFDLEDPVDLNRLAEPMTALANLRGLVIIDEIQRQPGLFPVLRVLADRKPLRQRFLILGSASPSLLRQSSESLAGRLETIRISGFSLQETGLKQRRKLWLRGGFPLAYLARSNKDSHAWRKNFCTTFLERDLSQLGLRIPSTSLMRFWTMLAHYHGQIWNAAEPARSLGLGETAIRRYLDVLTDVFMVRQLQPWHANIKKRQVKSPKLYLHDSGILHTLLGIQSLADLLSHPRCGASWEGLIIEEILKTVMPDEAYFWATHNGAELDLYMRLNSKWYGVECKRQDAPGMTRSLQSALHDLEIHRIAVIYPGVKRYPIAPRVEAVPFDFIARGISGIFP